MNNVNLIGNLTRDPELKYSTGANQVAVCRFSLAINEGYGDKRETIFLNIVVFGKQGENCDRFLSKGSKVAVTGRIQTGSYTNRDGNKVNTFDIIANRVEFLSGGGQSKGYDQQSSFDHQASYSQPQEDNSMDVPGGFSAIDEDVPF